MLLFPFLLIWGTLLDYWPLIQLNVRTNDGR